MRKICSSVQELIGGTPLMELSQVEKECGLKARLLAKLEMYSATGSAKDRIALEMIRDAEEKGILKPGSAIIEPTSGNTGIALAAVGAARGYRVIIVMPSSMSPERRTLMKAYGAKLVLSDGGKGMAGAIAKAAELHRQIPDSFIPGQFTNPANWKAHYKTTGPEIFRDTEGKVDAFVAGVGTGGTLTGVGKYLKEKKPGVRIIAVEPAGSAVLEGRSAGSHAIQGIGAGFVPEVLDTSVYDEVIAVSDEDALQEGAKIASREGILAGISSGAALHAGIQVAKRREMEGKTVVVLFPDSGDRYLSTKMFAKE